MDEITKIIIAVWGCVALVVALIILEWRRGK
jgi:hypothetical protein